MLGGLRGSQQRSSTFPREGVGVWPSCRATGCTLDAEVRECGNRGATTPLCHSSPLQHPCRRRRQYRNRWRGIAKATRFRWLCCPDSIPGAAGSNLGYTQRPCPTHASAPLCQDCDDLYIIEYARSKDGEAEGGAGQHAFIVTNDMFRDHIQRNGSDFGAWVKGHIVSYSFVTDAEFVPNPAAMRSVKSALSGAGRTSHTRASGPAPPTGSRSAERGARLQERYGKPARSRGAGTGLEVSTCILSDSDEGGEDEDGDVVAPGASTTAVAGPSVPAAPPASSFDLSSGGPGAPDMQGAVPSTFQPSAAVQALPGAAGTVAPISMSATTAGTSTAPPAHSPGSVSPAMLATTCSAYRKHVVDTHYIGGALPLFWAPAAVVAAAQAVQRLPALPTDREVMRQVFEAAPARLKRSGRTRFTAAVVCDVAPIVGARMFNLAKTALQPRDVGELPPTYAQAAFAASATRCIMGRWLAYLGEHDTTRRQVFSYVTLHRLPQDAGDDPLSPAALEAAETALNERRVTREVFGLPRSDEWAEEARARGVREVRGRAGLLPE